MSYKTPEEVKQQYVDSMGAELGRLFHELGNECSWLHWKWGEYVTLFGSKPERIDLLNAAAGAFFRIVQDCLWEDTLLHIARLTDPPESAGKKNLTLQRLPTLVVPEVRAKVDTLLKDCLAKSEFARDWRRRRIAHRDLQLALSENARPLEHASRQTVRQSIESIAAMLNGVESHYLHSEVAYEFTSQFPNAESLLYVLRDGVEADRQRRKRLESGNIEPGDLHPPAV